MRMSCNGCRVLRKGCSENCSIRPCLQWIKSPDSQANATLFLAKFYGRAGLLNLIEAGPENLRPGIFRSLLYEACGRVINPVYGSVGLLWSGNWAECQAAVDAVLKGSSITHTSSSESSLLQQQPISPLKTYDIRHVSKDPTAAAAAAAAAAEDDDVVVVDKVKTTRTRFKRSKRQVGTSSSSYKGSWMSGHFENNNDDSKEDESMFSGETVEGSLVNQTAKKVPVFKFTNQTEESADVGLELTLGLAPAAQSGRCKLKLGKN